MTRRHPIRTATMALAIGALAMVPPASAHVTLQPSETDAGDFVRLDVRVPNERERALTTSVDVQLPDGFFFVSYEPEPGWEIELVRERLQKPVPSPFNPEEELTEQINEIKMRATQERFGIAPGEFRDFGLSLRTPDEPGTTLTFPAIQRYGNGEIVRWIGPRDAEEPAARVQLLEAGSTESGANPGEDDDGPSTALVIFALVVGALGLASGASALAISRRGSA